MWKLVTLHATPEQMQHILNKPWSVPKPNQVVLLPQPNQSATISQYMTHDFKAVILRQKKLHTVAYIVTYVMCVCL